MKLLTNHDDFNLRSAPCSKGQGPNHNNKTSMTMRASSSSSSSSSHDYDPSFVQKLNQQENDQGSVPDLPEGWITGLIGPGNLSFYAVLGVRPGATALEVEAACMDRFHIWHPAEGIFEGFRTDQEFNKEELLNKQARLNVLQKAYHTLLEPKRRFQYDEYLRAMSHYDVAERPQSQYWHVNYAVDYLTWVQNTVLSSSWVQEFPDWIWMEWSDALQQSGELDMVIPQRRIRSSQSFELSSILSEASSSALGREFSFNRVASADESGSDTRSISNSVSTQDRWREKGPDITAPGNGLDFTKIQEILVDASDKGVVVVKKAKKIKKAIDKRAEAMSQKPGIAGKLSIIVADVNDASTAVTSAVQESQQKIEELVDSGIEATLPSLKKTHAGVAGQIIGLIDDVSVVGNSVSTSVNEAKMKIEEKGISSILEDVTSSVAESMNEQLTPLGNKVSEILPEILPEVPKPDLAGIIPDEVLGIIPDVSYHVSSLGSSVNEQLKLDEHLQSVTETFFPDATQLQTYIFEDVSSWKAYLIPSETKSTSSTSSHVPLPEASPVEDPASCNTASCMGQHSDACLLPSDDTDATSDVYSTASGRRASKQASGNSSWSWYVLDGLQSGLISMVMITEFKTKSNDMETYPSCDAFAGEDVEIIQQDAEEPEPCFLRRVKKRCIAMGFGGFVLIRNPLWYLRAYLRNRTREEILKNLEGPSAWYAASTVYVLKMPEPDSEPSEIMSPSHSFANLSLGDIAPWW